MTISWVDQQIDVADRGSQLIGAAQQAPPHTARIEGGERGGDGGDDLRHCVSPDCWPMQAIWPASGWPIDSLLHGAQCATEVWQAEDTAWSRGRPEVHPRRHA
jgi:hypothetical protein